MKNLYDKINDEKFNFDDYEIKDFTEFEKKKYKKNFKKKISHKKKRFAAIAAAVILVTAIISTDLGPMVYAKMEDILSNLTYSIKTATDSNENIEKYTAVINKEVSDNTISIKLNDVAIADKNHIYISAIVKNPKDYDLLTMDKKIYINGKRYKELTSSGSTEYNAEKDVTYIYSEIGLNRDIDLNKEINMTIEITNLMFTDKTTGAMKNIKGNWEFNFMASGHELLLDTKEYKLNNIIKSEDETVKFTNLKINKLDQTLNAEIIKKGKKAKMYEVYGIDNLGNKVVFDLRESDGKNIYFKTQKNKINENATELHLTVKSMDFPEQSGKLDNTQMKDAGSFTVKLK